MTFKLSCEENPNQEDIQVLIHGITDYAKQQRGFDALDFYAFFIRDENNTIVGGCNGGTLYGGLHIDSLWVSDTIRNKGWGTKLVNAVLTYGKEKNCNFATVNTMDWEALGFYQKLGFKTEFQRSFKDQHVPEIMDLNVLPSYRNKGIGTRLLEVAEQLAATQSPVVGLGSGLYDDYGNAQKLYIKKGYIPDGYGVTYNYQPVIPGDNAPVDDDLVLWFTKNIS
jgi:GNAT superfamily N-acetyltransferase